VALAALRFVPASMTASRAARPPQDAHVAIAANETSARRYLTMRGHMRLSLRTKSALHPQKLAPFAHLRLPGFQ
jgi:hypothetical protein